MPFSSNRKPASPKQSAICIRGEDREHNERVVAEVEASLFVLPASKSPKANAF
jgi:hypothetical protein